MNVIGYVIFYEGYVKDGVFVRKDGGWQLVLIGMMQEKPERTICITPVDEVPEGISS